MGLRGVWRVVRVLIVYLVYRPRSVYVGALVPAAIVVVFWFLGGGRTVTDDERNVTVALLEVFGLILIAKGYADIRVRFGRPTLADAWSRYWSELRAALRGPTNVTLRPGPAVMHFSAGNARLTVRAGPDTPLQQRVELLERRVEDIDTEVVKLEGQFTRDSTALRSEVASLRVSTSGEMRELRALVEESSIGDAGVEVIGWLWLLSGALVSALPSASALLRAAP